MRTLTGRIVLMAGLAVVARPAAAAVPVTFESEYVVKSPTYGVLQSVKVTMKGRLVRFQQRTGVGLKLLYLRNRQGTYHVNLHTLDGARWPADLARNLENRLVTFGPQGDPRDFFEVAGARRTSRTTIHGRPAEVWSYTLPTTTGAPQTVRVFIDARTRRPLQAESRMSIAAGRFETVTIEYKSYRWSFPLPDTAFDLPPGARITDLQHPEARPIVVPASRQQPARSTPRSTATSRQVH